ncbi:monofunctional biosynthetic peptidoglycan transglycosylase [Vandammella animalimorsus]|uniref:monofunctional biosynthetic peptidoglycan transglycosylase n=1 Tax=Vandammella animalimorsus TaxID=2029117 RepID=UPI003CCF2CA1
MPPAQPVPAANARPGLVRRLILFCKRWLGMLLLAGLCLQLYFMAHSLALRWLEPGSTAFQRSALWHILQGRQDTQGRHWLHQPVPSGAINDHARKAVIAAEDNLFFQHSGADWRAIEQAWRRNAQGQSRLLGGSTITQQLAKNLHLSGQRSLLRKGQELLLSWMLEATLPKQRILDLYLNQVEWGTGIYGIEAAAKHYFGVSASQLNAAQSARLAVMLPQPRRLGLAPHSPYMNRRTQVIVQRMPAIALPSPAP